MSEQRPVCDGVSTVVETVGDFDRFAAEALPDFLERATNQTRRFLRETGQWADDITHEKLAVRWGYELVERFLATAPAEVPCRPFLLLDSLVAKYFSQAEPLRYHQGCIVTPLGRFLDGLTSRAVVSRDAMMALFYHLYGLGQGQVVRLLGLGPAESQRVYKNFERWRRTGWQRAMTEIGMTEKELKQLEDEKSRKGKKFNDEAAVLLREVQAHYRKSEPEHFRCLESAQWAALFEQGYGYDYRVWHLALCRDCMLEVYRLRQEELAGIPPPEIELQVHPLQKGRVVSFVWRHRGDANGAARPVPRVSAAAE